MSLLLLIFGRRKPNLSFFNDFFSITANCYNQNFLNISRTAIKDKQLLDINVFETVLHQKDELKILSQNIYSQRFEEIREIFKAENEEYDIQVFISDDIFHQKLQTFNQWIDE